MNELNLKCIMSSLRLLYIIYNNTNLNVDNFSLNDLHSYLYKKLCLKRLFKNCVQAELTPKDMERARFAFDIYDFEGKARMDLFYLGDCLRGLNLNPTLKMIAKLGGTKKKGENFLKLEEVNTEQMSRIDPNS